MEDKCRTETLFHRESSDSSLTINVHKQKKKCLKCAIQWFGISIYTHIHTYTYIHLYTHIYTYTHACHLVVSVWWKCYCVISSYHEVNHFSEVIHTDILKQDVKYSSCYKQGSWGGGVWWYTVAILATLANKGGLQFQG